VQACVNNAQSQYTYTQGCAQSLDNLIAGSGKIGIGIAAGIVGLEIILIILAFIVLCVAGGTDKYV